MNKLLTLFKGKLTYTMAAIAIVAGIWGLATGNVDATNSWAFIWAGLAAFGIRRAM